MVERTQQDRELDTFWSLASRRLRLPGVPVVRVDTTKPYDVGALVQEIASHFV